MKIPPRINFKNIEPSQALQSRIEEKIDRLNERFHEIIGCHVTVESAHKHQHKGRLYNVRISVTLPGEELVVSHHPGKDPIKHEKVFAAMNNAFAAIEKQLAKRTDLSRRDVKQHEPHWQNGVILNLIPEENYGFIKLVEGDEVYFHSNAVENNEFDKLKIGEKARVVVADGEGRKGPQASIVRPLGK